MRILPVRVWDAHTRMGRYLHRGSIFFFCTHDELGTRVTGTIATLFILVSQGIAEKGLQSLV